MKPRVIYIVGPTGTGKTELAASVAEALDAEIVTADSVQVYRWMDIGTGKPSVAQRSRVPHHLIDIVDPKDDFTVADFRRCALRTIDSIRAQGKPVIVSGGSGLYLKVLAHGLLTGPGSHPEIRAHIEEEIRVKGRDHVHASLCEIDPLSAARIHPHNQRRMIRAIEVYRATGKPMSEWQREHGFQEAPFAVLKIGLDVPRTVLYRRLDLRCEQMLAQGLMEEVQGLRAMGYGFELKAMQSVGYRHMGGYLRGEWSLDEALALMQRDTRHLAKRQMTWFRRDAEIQWYQSGAVREIVAAGRKFLCGDAGEN